MTKSVDKCPNDRDFGDKVCRNGYLWELTYSEMGPPDQRQQAGPCPRCNREKYDAEQDTLRW